MQPRAACQPGPRRPQRAGTHESAGRGVSPASMKQVPTLPNATAPVPLQTGRRLPAARRATLLESGPMTRWLGDQKSPPPASTRFATDLHYASPITDSQYCAAQAQCHSTIGDSPTVRHPSGKQVPLATELLAQAIALNAEMREAVHTTAPVSEGSHTFCPPKIRSAGVPPHVCYRDAYGACPAGFQARRHHRWRLPGRHGLLAPTPGGSATRGAGRPVVRGTASARAIRGVHSWPVASSTARSRAPW